MEVATYEIETLDVQVDDEAIKLAEEFGLTGQVEMMTGKQAVPYRPLDSKALKLIESSYDLMDVSRYKSSVIPIEALKVLAFVQNNWDGCKVVAGQGVVDGNSYVMIARKSTEAFLLASWGKPFNEEELGPSARLAFHASKLAKLKQIKGRVDTLIAALEPLSEQEIIATTELGSLPSFFE